MEWLGDLLGMGATVASGGLFGVVGSLLGVVAKHYQEKQRQAWETKKWGHEESMQKLQMEARSQETEQEIELADSEGSWRGLSESIRADAQTKPTSGWATNIKALFRPFLTVVLWCLAGWVFWHVLSSMTDPDDPMSALPVSEIKELIKYMVYTIFFSASMATAWWFGDRALTPPQHKHK